MPFDIGQSSTRQPRGIVKLSDSPIDGWTRFEVNNNVFTAADTFRVEFVVRGLPADRTEAWFSAQQDMYVECFAGFPDDPTAYAASELKSLIYGQVDEIDYDPEHGVITVSGRDLTREFIDTKTTEKWPNLTASQIATLLAQRHGLTPVVSPTTAKAGKYYQIDFVNMADERTEWDILCYLADVENHRVYVRGKSLYFQPRPDESTATPYVLQWKKDDINSANMIRPVFSRNLNVSRGIQVVIRSWNAKQGKGFNATYPSSKPTSIKPGQSSTKTQIYRKTIHGLTQEEALRRAKSLYDQLIQHEMKLRYESPADNELDINTVLEVRGTETDFDQRYFPDSIQRSLDVSSGYAMSVSAKNHAPDSQASV